MRNTSRLRVSAFVCKASSPLGPPPRRRAPGSMNPPLCSAGGMITINLSPSSVAELIWNDDCAGMRMPSRTAISTSTRVSSLSSGSFATRPIFAPPMRTSEPLIRPEASSNTTVITYSPPKRSLKRANCRINPPNSNNPARRKTPTSSSVRFPDPDTPNP